MFKDSLFNKIEKKTNINKETILSLASKLQNNNIKDEKTIKEVRETNENYSHEEDFLNRLKNLNNNLK